MNTADRLHAHCLFALSDPHAYQGGNNGVAAVEQARERLLRWLDQPDDGRTPWRCMPRLIGALLTLYDQDEAGYAAFMKGALHAQDDDVLDLRKIRGLWLLDSVLGALSDDHDYVLGGEGSSCYLAYQERVPQWKPLARPADVLGAVEARLAACAPTATVSANARRGPTA